MKRRGAAVNVALAIFTFIAALSITSIGLDSFINLDELVQAATIEFQATRMTTVIFAAQSLEGDSRVAFELPDNYEVTPDVDVGEVDYDGSLLTNPDGTGYPGKLSIGDGEAPIVAGTPIFSEAVESTQWCVESNGHFEPIDESEECVDS